MKTATDLLAELIQVYDDPEQSTAQLYLWVHQHVGEIREAIEGGDDTARLHWIEGSLSDLHCNWDTPDAWTVSMYDSEAADTMQAHGLTVRAAIDRARGEGE